MLRGTGALDEWAGRENPDDTTWRQVAEVVFQVGRVPWVSPSRPETFGEGGSTEIRSIPVEATTVAITYEHEHETGIVDLLLVGS